MDVLDSAALSRANKAMHTIKPPREFDIFWTKLIDRVPGREGEFLEAFLSMENLDYLMRATSSREHGTLGLRKLQCGERGRVSSPA